MTFAAEAFAGRHILITGASSGLGRHTAMRLAECGARLALVGRDEGRLAAALVSLVGGGHTSHAIDMSDADITADAVSAIAKAHGAFTGVFHSAGSALVLPARITKNRHLDEVFAGGFRGAFGVARAAAKKGVVEDGTPLVFMSSIAAVRGRQGMTAYAASKAAVSGMVRALAVELAERRIRANAIVAGGIETAMHEDLVASLGEAQVASYRALHPLGFGSPDDVAYAVMFLLSDAARWITGTELVVDGGYAAK